MARGTVECTCRRCGCTFTMQRKFYSRREADEWESWATSNGGQYDLCSQCYSLERAEEAAKKVAEFNTHLKDEGYPDLTGTPKQIAWAGKIRAKFIGDWEEFTSRCQENSKPEFREAIGKEIAQCEEVCKGMNTAKEWIDIRDEFFRIWLMKKTGIVKEEENVSE